MMSYQNLKSSISKFAWGYFFLYININLGTLNILPAFVGYFLFLSSIKDLQIEEKSIALLKPFGIILLIWKAVCWSLDLFSLSNSLVFITLITSIIEIYFHFQALTNIASIAKKSNSKE